jgi:hypothetical protein
MAETSTSTETAMTDPPVSVKLDPPEAVAPAPVGAANGVLREDALFQLLTQIAAVLSQPLRYFHPDHFQHLSIDENLLRLLAGDENFHKPLQLAVASELGLEHEPPPDILPAELAASGEARLAATIVAAEPQVLRRAACMLGAAILQEPLSRLVARTDRERAVDSLGQRAFQAGVREAPMLYSDLRRLCPETLDFGDAEEDEPWAWGVALGFAWLHEFVSVSQPALARLCSLRVPAGPGVTDPLRMDCRCRSLLVKLLSRKIPEWSSCIA